MCMGGERCLFWGHLGTLVPGGYSVTEMLLRDPNCGCSLGQPIPGRAAKRGVPGLLPAEHRPAPSLPRWRSGPETLVLN